MIENISLAKYKKEKHSYYINCEILYKYSLDDYHLQHTCRWFEMKSFINDLIELKEQLYDKIKETVVDEVELDGFDLIFEENLKYKKYVYKINELFMMTPYYYTTHNNFDINLKECEVSFDFLIRLYKKRK